MFIWDGCVYGRIVSFFDHSVNDVLVFVYQPCLVFIYSKLQNLKIIRIVFGKIDNF